MYRCNDEGRCFNCDGTKLLPVTRRYTTGKDFMSDLTSTHQVVEYIECRYCAHVLARQRK